MDNLKLNLEVFMMEDKRKSEQAKERMRKINEKRENYIPTWEEVWETGYYNKKGILQTKLSENDRRNLLEVKKAIENGEIGIGVENLSKFTKTHALGLYKVLIQQRINKIIQEMIKNKPENYHLVNNITSFNNMLQDVNNSDKIALDTETTGVEYSDKIVGVSISTENNHYYIPVRHNNAEQLSPEFVFNELKPIIENPQIGKLLHNAKFDFHMFYKEGIRVRGLYMDTMIAMHILNENEESFALKNLATKYGKHFGFDDKSYIFEELFGKTKFNEVPLDIATVYACKDTHLTWKLAHWIEGYLKQQPALYDLYFNIENKLVDISFEMELTGMVIDFDYAFNYKELVREQLDHLQTELDNYFPNINLNSPKQLSDYLFNKLKLPNINDGSVDADTLKQLENEYEGIKILLQYRDLHKLYNTYLVPLPEKVWDDMRLHGQFNQAGTVTGRFSSNNPNLQNIPPEARELIVAPKGHIIVGIDLSAIEPRVLAHLSGDKGMQEPFKKGVDLYSTLASKIFKVPIEECGDGSKYRKMMKVGLLATMYGISNMQLAKSLGISEQEAEQFMADFLKEYPKVKEFIENTHKTVLKQGYVEMMFGRKRRFQPYIRQYRALITDKDYNKQKQAKSILNRIKRQSVNSIIQGSAAIILKLGMIRAYEMCQKKGWKMFATIHDELLFYVPEDVTEQEIIELSECMTKAVTLDVPLKCDIEISKRWGKGVPFKDWLANRSILDEKEKEYM